MSGWQLVLIEPTKTLISQIGQFLSNLLLVIIILILGWIIAKFIKSLVVKVLKMIKLDELSDRIELNSLLAKGGINYSLSEMLGVICYWLTLLVAMVIAINSIGLTIAAELLNRVVLYIPNVIAAIFILIFGMFAATLLRNIVQTAANNAGLYQAKFLAKLVEAAVVVFAIIITLEQLNIGARIIELSISVILASFGLALAIAFGLGCKDLAGKFMSDLLDKMKSKK
ncbi:MAG: hypothetical protein ABH882_01770 [Candidatus Omnitrophota bacterium]|nr:hypothetical protein [Candidatus Omnitrophota bacterium]MBU1929312.1 hypothetical protein [Candidatus Omnitrophota bacterium]MBU2035604.1 hypothetical protein [Candidatus Omnitrophota bacterium]